MAIAFLHARVHSPNCNLHLRMKARRPSVLSHLTLESFPWCPKEIVRECNARSCALKSLSFCHHFHTSVYRDNLSDSRLAVLDPQVLPGRWRGDPSPRGAHEQ